MYKLVTSCTFLFLTISGFSQKQKFKDKFDDAVPVLNFGTFHMGYTPDANKTEFDEHNKKNQEDVRNIAKQLAAFKPTVIIIETQPKYDSSFQAQYLEYLQNPNMHFKEPGEIELLAYELGRLSGTKKIYGIDYKEGYNYSIYYQLKNKIVDSLTYKKYGDLVDSQYDDAKYDQLPTKEKLKLTNHPQYLDFLINANADMLTYVATPGKNEGADEAAKLYHRNLVMFSNLNKIPLTKNDRVFIIMGASHTAFFNDFMRRSPKYKLVNVFDYLK